MQKTFANEQKCQAEAMEVFMHGNHAMGWHWHWRGKEYYACITLHSNNVRLRQCKCLCMFEAHKVFQKQTCLLNNIFKWNQLRFLFLNGSTGIRERLY